jgi:hypothetical protein
VEHLSLEERLLLPIALRLELVGLVGRCLLLLHNGRRRLFATFLLGFGLLDLDLAGLLDLLRFRCGCLVCAGGGLAGVIIVVV